jgi:NitT/TauT family transport system substrate-binding protein
MGINTAPNLLLSAEAGIDLVAVAGGARLTKENAKVALVTRKDLVVAKAEDLKGKRVGVPGINSIIEIFLRKWLINHKVPLNQVTIVEAAMPLMGDLVRTGQIDAVTPIEPILGRIVASVAGVKSVDFFSEVNPDVIGSFWTTMRPWAAANPAAIAGFRASLAEGLAFIRANPERAKQIEEKYLHTTSTVIPSYTLDVKPGDFDFFVKLGLELGINRRPVDTSKLVLNELDFQSRCRNQPAETGTAGPSRRRNGQPIPRPKPTPASSRRSRPRATPATCSRMSARIRDSRTTSSSTSTRMLPSSRSGPRSLT